MGSTMRDARLLKNIVYFARLKKILEQISLNLPLLIEGSVFVTLRG